MGSRLVLIVTMLFVVSCRPHAPNVPDPRSPEEKAWDAAHDLENAHRPLEARAAYQRMCARKPPVVRACFDYARLMFETASPKEARAVAIWTISHFPDEGLAVSMVKQLARSYADNGEIPPGIRDLSSLEEALRTNAIDDSLLYEIARLYREGKDATLETRTLEVIVSRFDRWSSQVWDDALWRLAAIAREEDRTRDEIQWLERLLSEKESSRLLGSYNSPYHDDTMLRLGEIYLAEKRYDDAYRMFIELSEFKTSRMTDDGLFSAAKVEIERGNLKNACRLLLNAVREDGSVKREAAALRVSIRCAP